MMLGLPIFRCLLIQRYIQGVYVLTDNMFRPFARMSMANRTEAVIKAQTVSHFRDCT